MWIVGKYSCAGCASFFDIFRFASCGCDEITQGAHAPLSNNVFRRLGNGKEHPTDPARLVRDGARAASPDLKWDRQFPISPGQTSLHLPPSALGCALPITGRAASLYSMTSSGPHATNIANRGFRQMLTEVLRLCGHCSMGPSAVFDQSSERMSAPISPGLANSPSAMFLDCLDKVGPRPPIHARTILLSACIKSERPRAFPVKKSPRDKKRWPAI